MRNTENYNFNLPEEDDFYNVEHFNENFTAIDKELKEIEDGTQQVGDSAKLGGKDASEYTLSKNFNAGDNYIVARTDEEKAINGWVYQLVAGAEGVKVWASNDNWVTYKTVAEYLPLSGGTVGNGTSDSPFGIKGKDHAFMEFSNKDSYIFGRIGFNAGKELTMYDTDWVGHKILHEGNKPSGTYTGNGSAEKRIIQTGGIGKVCVINGGGRMAYVSIWGAIILSGTSVVALDYNKLNFNNGALNVETTDYINDSGTQYTWDVM